MTPKYRMLDLFCGRWGWSQAFAARGWECVGVDLVEPSTIPDGCRFVKMNILDFEQMGPNRVLYADCVPCLATGNFYGRDEDDDFLPCDDCAGTGANAISADFDFICASSPCEEFSVHGMKHFHPNPKYPENGIRLFNHTREICEASGVPYVMENVRAAQQFVGKAVHHCGPFYLWGTGVPAVLPQGIVKGLVLGGGGAVLKMIANGATRAEIKEYRRKHDEHWNSSGSEARKKSTAMFATIPPELSNAVADYAERLLEQKQAGIVACHERSF